MVISIIACIAENGAIGKDNQLLFHIAEDLHRFKLLTTGHTVIMGRLTYESLPNGALPNRRNVVLSKTATPIAGCEVYPSLQEALASCRESEKEVFIIGGASVYRQAIDMADKLYLTIVNKNPQDADAFFPTIQHSDWKIAKQALHLEDDLSYQFLLFTRRHRQKATPSQAEATDG